MKNYNESFDNFIDKSLVFFEKPIEKLTNQTISLYHGTFDDIHNKIMPMGPNVGATKFSKPRWSCYYWDDFESAMKWSIAWAVQRFAEVGVMWPMVPAHGDKLMLKNKNGISDNELRQMIVDKKIITYVYEIKIKANDIEMGSVPSIKEYTVSKPMPIYKKHKILITRKLLDKYFRTVSVDEWLKAKEFNKMKYIKYKRGPILNRILDNHRDPYRRWIKQDVASGRIKVGDDISHYKDMINYGVKNDVLGLNKEGVEMDNINDELNNLLEECILLHEVNLVKDIDDNYRNLDQWKPTPGKNILFITGLSGSGKSTLARELAATYGAKIIELDAIERHANAADSDDKLGKLIKRAMEFDMDYGYSKVHDQGHEGAGTRDRQKFYKSTKRIIRYIVNELWHTRTLYIVEGIQIIEAFKYEELRDKPFVFKQTSMLTSLRQRAYRSAKKQGLEKPNLDIFWKDVWSQAAWYMNSTTKFNKFKNRMEMDDEQKINNIEGDDYSEK